jgi:hypothetical protein
VRLVFGIVAAFLGLLSIVLTARYGYKSADTALDGIISAAIFGAIALCAFLFDGAAVRLWFNRRFGWSIVIGVIAGGALCVTVTNSLGGIAGRADAIQAERMGVQASRNELRRLLGERAKMAAFVPADDEAISAARSAVAAADKARSSECDKRGPFCRQRETDEKAARDTLNEVLSRRELTKQAAEWSRLADVERVKLATAPPVENPNPLGHALELIVGTAAATLTAWQQATVALVFELCLVGVMVVFELLGQGPKQPRARAAKAPPVEQSPARAWGVRPKPPAPPGAVADCLAEVLEPEPDGRVEVRSMYARYKSWCAKAGKAPHPGPTFVEHLGLLKQKAGLDFEADGEKVYCLGVRLAA